MSSFKLCLLGGFKFSCFFSCLVRYRFSGCWLGSWCLCCWLRLGWLHSSLYLRLWHWLRCRDRFWLNIRLVNNSSKIRLRITFFLWYFFIELSFLQLIIVFIVPESVLGFIPIVIIICRTW